MRKEEWKLGSKSKDVFIIEEDAVQDHDVMRLDTREHVSYDQSLAIMHKLNQASMSADIRENIHALVQNLFNRIESIERCLREIYTFFRYIEDSGKCNTVALDGLAGDVPLPKPKTQLAQNCIYLVFNCPVGDPAGKTWECPKNIDRWQRIWNHLCRDRDVPGCDTMRTL